MQQLRERRALRWSNGRSTCITESSSLLVAFGSAWAADAPGTARDLGQNAVEELLPGDDATDRPA